MRWIREPLVHFTALGAVLFLAYAVASDLFAVDGARQIVMDETAIEFLADGWQRQWQRPPTAEELRGLVDARIREEVLYREAQALGLDVNDVVVRRRMVQKMELLSQDLALLADPTDQELRAFFAEHPDDYVVPPRISFSHIYFNVDRRGAAVEDDARRVLEEIRSRRPVHAGLRLSSAGAGGDSAVIWKRFRRRSSGYAARVERPDRVGIRAPPGEHHRAGGEPRPRVRGNQRSPGQRLQSDAP